jgi:hypothetical protein
MLNRVWIASPNCSTRGGSGIRCIVLHTAEGALSYQSLGNYFASPASSVSSHVGIDDTPGTVGEYVARAAKAWTQGNANPYCVSAELCAFAAWTPADWAGHPQMLANAAAWVAEEAAALGIPIRALSASEAQGGASGVCQHVDLGAWGGNHWDCGPNFPMDQVLAMAGGATTTPQPEEDDDVKPFLFQPTDTPGGATPVFVSDGALVSYRLIRTGHELDTVRYLFAQAQPPIDATIHPIGFGDMGAFGVEITDD